jgi:hypothetical protein
VEKLKLKPCPRGPNYHEEIKLVDSTGLPLKAEERKRD